MLAALFNGSPVDREHAVSLDDRGFNYGDGLFETMRLRDGRVALLEAHCSRLMRGCERLGIPFSNRKAIADDVASLAKVSMSGIVKIVITRGTGGRGYRPPENPTPARSAMLFASADFATEIQGRWCATRLARQPQLAGIKHLNRLEHVLAQSEWRDASIDEGLMLDTEGEVICGTASNLFVVRDGVLSTPDLRFCGVIGVMRNEVLARAARLGIAVKECSIWREGVLSASELFVTNAVRGIRPILSIDAQRWEVGRITRRLLESLKEDE